MIGPEHVDAAVFRRIARRVEGILEAAGEREQSGESLALDVDAQFRLEDVAAVQFQVATVILEETGGISQEEVLGELLALGLASVLGDAATAAGVSADGMLPDGEDGECMPLERAPSGLNPDRAGFARRLLN